MVDFYTWTCKENRILRYKKIDTEIIDKLENKKINFFVLCTVASSFKVGGLERI